MSIQDKKQRRMVMDAFGRITPYVETPDYSTDLMQMAKILDDITGVTGVGFEVKGRDRATLSTKPGHALLSKGSDDPERYPLLSQILSLTPHMEVCEPHRTPELHARFSPQDIQDILSKLEYLQTVRNACIATAGDTFLGRMAFEQDVLGNPDFDLSGAQKPETLRPSL